MAGAQKGRSPRRGEKKAPTVVVVVLPAPPPAPDDKWSRRGFVATLASVVLGVIAWLYPQAPQSPPVATAPVRIGARDEVKLTEALDVRITPRTGELQVAATAPTVNFATATTSNTNVIQPPL